MTFSKNSLVNAHSVQVADILQFCCMNGLTGVIEVREPSSSGRIYLSEGMIVDAETEREQGESALFNLVNSTTPDLEFQETLHNRAHAINKEWEYLLLEAARLRDVKAHDGAPPLTASKGDVPAGCRLLLVPQSSVVTVKPAPTGDKTDKVVKTHDVALVKSQLAAAGLQPGNELTIQIGGKGLHFKCKLVGLDHGAFIVVSFPLSRAAAQKIYRNETLAVRYLWNGSVWGFHASVLSTTQTPAPLIFLSYPESIERYDLREKERVDCLIPARMKLNGKMIEGVIVDISTSGCKFSRQGRLGMTIRLDDEIGLDMNIPVQNAASDTIIGNVKNVTQSEGRIHMGIKFHPLSRAMEETIEAYIRTISPAS